jgi:hypothetical protein
MAEEGTWTKVGVIIGGGALILAYIGVAAGLKWWPFEHASSGNTPIPSSSTPIAPSSPTLTSSPSPTPSIGSVGATFLNLTWARAISPAYYVYTIEIRITGLAGQTCTVDWQTVDSSGAPAGTNGKTTTGTLPYNDDTWTDDAIDVTAPPGSYQGMQWHTDFTVYAPNGVEMASDSG